MTLQRCHWCAENDELCVKYHDAEWGVPVHDDIKHFGFLVLEITQAGLSWKTVLNKREGFRQAYDDFDPRIVADYDQRQISQLMQNAGIIRNLKKIEAAINNAGRFLEIQEEFGSFDRYMWGFAGDKPLVGSWKHD